MRTVPALLAGLLLVTAAGTPVAVAADGPARPAVGQTETVTLTVTVVDQVGNPIRDVTVVAEWADGSNSAETASNGKAFVDVPRGADVTLRIRDNRYVRNEPVVVGNATERAVEVDVALQASLSVRVTNATGPVPGATVRLLRGDTFIAAGETGPDGEFESGTVEKGTYTLVVREPGYFPVGREIEVSGDDDRTVELRSGTATVRIRVRDDHFSPPRPVGDASVTVSDIGTQRTVDGIVTFTVPVYTDHRVTVTKDGYGSTTLNVSVADADRSLNATITRERAVVVEPANDRVVVGETVAVRVVNAYGEPIEGATVRIEGDPVGETDAEGRASVPIESRGELTVRARAGGIASEPVTVTGVATPTATRSPTPSPSPSPGPTPTPDAGLIDLSDVEVGPVTAGLGVALLIVLLFVLRRAF